MVKNNTGCIIQPLAANMKNMENLPQWLKRVGIGSVVLAGLDVIASLLLWVPCYSARGCDGLGEAIITSFVLAPILVILAVFWVIVAVMYRFGQAKPWFHTALMGLTVVFAVAIALILGYFLLNVFLHP